MANDCSVVQLKSSREDEFAILVIACPFGWPFPYVRPTPHPQQSAVSSHPPELAIVEALITEGPGQQDVIHVPLGRGRRRTSRYFAARRGGGVNAKYR
jgi:hypothetical protein